MAISENEKRELIANVVDVIKTESSDITELETVGNLDGVVSFPAMKGKKLVNVPLKLINKSSDDYKGEVLTFVRGMADGSSAYTDPFLRLGAGKPSFNFDTDAELSAVLDALCGEATDEDPNNDAARKWTGRLRATVKGMNVEIWQFVQNFRERTFSQVIAGNVVPSADGRSFFITTVEHFDILKRYCVGGTWSAWKNFTQDLEDSIPHPQDTATATADGLRYVYSVDSPDAKNSVLNAPDTLIKQQNGELRFQKGLWNPLGQAVYYTRNRVPVATEGSDGAMAKEVFARLGTGGTLREGTPTTLKVPIVYPNWAAGGTRTFDLLAATSARAGVMSAADKDALDRLAQASAQFTVSGEYCRATDGAMVPDAGYCRSAFVPIDRTAAFSMTGGGASPAAKVAFFDADLRFISAIPYGSSSTPAYPDGAAWFVCSTRVAALSGSKYSPTAGSEATMGAAAALMAGKVDKAALENLLLSRPLIFRHADFETLQGQNRIVDLDYGSTSDEIAAVFGNIGDAMVRLYEAVQSGRPICFVSQNTAGTIYADYVSKVNVNAYGDGADYTYSAQMTFPSKDEPVADSEKKWWLVSINYYPSTGIYEIMETVKG